MSLLHIGSWAAGRMGANNQSYISKLERGARDRPCSPRSAGVFGRTGREGGACVVLRRKIGLGRDQPGAARERVPVLRRGAAGQEAAVSMSAGRAPTRLAANGDSIHRGSRQGAAATRGRPPGDPQKYSVTERSTATTAARIEDGGGGRKPRARGGLHAERKPADLSLIANPTHHQPWPRLGFVGAPAFPSRRLGWLCFVMR